MPIKTKITFSFLLLYLLLPSVTIAVIIKEEDTFWAIEFKYVELRLSKINAQVTGILDKFSKSPLNKEIGGLYLIDNKSIKELFPKSATFSRINNNTLEIKIDFGDPTIKVTSIINCTDILALNKIIIENNGQNQRQLEVRFGLPIDYASAGGRWNYWDGYDGFEIDCDVYPVTNSSNRHSINACPVNWKCTEVKKPTTPLISNIRRNMTIFPINCVFNSQYGIAIGLNPNYNQGYYAGGVQPVHSGYESFFYSLKFVVDPKDLTDQEFVIYDFNPFYRQRAALEVFYKSFPSLYSKRTNIDPRYNKAGTRTFLSQHIKILDEDYGNYWRGFCLRYNVGWTWLYAPFQTTGYFWPNESNYNPKKWKNNILKNLMTIQQFRDKTKSAHNVIGDGCAISYYMIPQRCDRTVADHNFKDSKVCTPSYKYLYHSPGPLNDKVTTMFSHNNSFGRELKKQINDIMSFGSFDGIGFDNSFANEEHILFSGIKQGRNFSSINNKVYVGNTISYTNLMNQVRNTSHGSSKGYFPAIVSNNPWVYSSAILSDVGLLEWHPQYPQKQFNAFAAMRYLLGPNKPFTYKIEGNRKAPQSDEEKEWFLNQRLHGLLQCFRFGAFPRIIEALGIVDVIDALPVLQQLSESGWNPVPGIKISDDEIWVERFGKELNTYIVLINTQNKTKNYTANLDKGYFGSGFTYFQLIWGNGGYKNSFTNEGSSIYGSLEPVWLQVFQSRVYIEASTLLDSVKFAETSIGNEGKITINFELSSTELTKIKISLPDLIYDIKVTVNDSPTPFSLNKNVLTIEKTLSSLNTVQVEWKNTVQWNCPQENILSFFVKDSLKGILIVSPEDVQIKPLTQKLKSYLIYHSKAKTFDKWYKTNVRSLKPDLEVKTGINVVSTIPENYKGQIIKIIVDELNKPAPPYNLKVLEKSIDNVKRISKASTLPISVKNFRLVNISLCDSTNNYQMLCIHVNNLQSLNIAIDALINLLNRYPTSYGYDYITDTFPENKGDLRQFPSGYKRFSWEEFVNYKTK